MTKKEFYEKYGDVVVEFSSYYKYTFTYKAVLPNGDVLTCGYGGDSSEIYRHSVSVGDKEIVRELYPYCGSIHRDGVEVESFYDY